MPNPLERLPSGRQLPRLPIPGDIVSGSTNRRSVDAPSFAGFAPYTSRPKQQWSWWEWVLLPLAVVVSAYQILWSKNIIKFFAVFMLVWAVFGAIAVDVDTRAGNGEMPRWLELTHERNDYYGPERRDCLFQGGVNARAGWPLGKLYLAGITCAAYVPHQIALNLGMESLAGRIDPLLGDVYYDYWQNGSWSLSYLGLGILFFWTMFTLPLWILLLILRPIANNLHISWGD